MSKESTTVSVICDANKLPEEIKTKAHDYVEKRKPRFRTFGIVSDDVEDAWLNGFAFCMEGEVTVKVKQCATCIYADSPCLPSEYEKGINGGCDHYKSVFEENAELKVEKAFCEKACEGADQMRKDLTKAKELLKRCHDTYVYSKSLKREIEQFLKDSEVKQ